MQPDPMRKALAAAVAMLLLAAACAGATSAAPAAKSSIGGTVRTGSVAISAGWSGAEAAAPLSPGSSVPLSATVSCNGDGCWIRARIDYEVQGAPFGAAFWTGGENRAAPEWELGADGWWYLSDPLPTGGTAEFSAEIEVPAFDQVQRGDEWIWVPAWDEAEAEKRRRPSPDPSDAASLSAREDALGAILRCTVTFEAVQERNFRPDPASPDPWNGAGSAASAAVVADRE